MPLVQLRPKAQVTIPAELRKSLGLEIGEYLEAEIQDNMIVLKPVKIIDQEDAWFWSKEWQEGERRADEDLKAGRYEVFDTTEELLESLREIRKNKSKNKK